MLGEICHYFWRARCPFEVTKAWAKGALEDVCSIPGRRALNSRRFRKSSLCSVVPESLQARRRSTAVGIETVCRGRMECAIQQDHLFWQRTCHLSYRSTQKITKRHYDNSMMSLDGRTAVLNSFTFLAVWDYAMIRTSEMPALFAASIRSLAPKMWSAWF